MVMNCDGIKKMGDIGEEKARLFLNKQGFKLTKPDWIGILNDKYYQFEIKMKSELFKPPPFIGHGFDEHQIKRRLHLQEKHNLPCIVIIFEANSDNIYVQSLHELERRRKFITAKQRIHVYPLTSFKIYNSNGDMIRKADE